MHILSTFVKDQHLRIDVCVCVCIYSLIYSTSLWIFYANTMLFYCSFVIYFKIRKSGNVKFPDLFFPQDCFGYLSFIKLHFTLEGQS